MKLPPPVKLVLACALISVPIAFVVAPGPEPLPALYPMPAFELIDQDGRPWSSRELAGRVAIVNFIFTSCPTVCPGLTAKMAALQTRLRDRDGIHLLSISVDPRNDTPEALRAYGARFGQDPNRWTFLTGDLGAIEAAVREGFKIHMDGAANPEATAFDIVHGEHFVLVDRRGTIRGYYRPSQEDQERLVDDALRLLNEPST